MTRLVAVISTCSCCIATRQGGKGEGAKGLSKPLFHHFCRGGVQDLRERRRGGAMRASMASCWARSWWSFGLLVWCAKGRVLHIGTRQRKCEWGVRVRA